MSRIKHKLADMHQKFCIKQLEILLEKRPEYNNELLQEIHGRTKKRFAIHLELQTYFHWDSQDNRHVVFLATRDLKPLKLAVETKDINWFKEKLAAALCLNVDELIVNIAETSDAAKKLGYTFFELECRVSQKGLDSLVEHTGIFLPNGSAVQLLTIAKEKVKQVRDEVRDAKGSGNVEYDNSGRTAPSPEDILREREKAKNPRDR